jgi:hypothetical protein
MRIDSDNKKGKKEKSGKNLQAGRKRPWQRLSFLSIPS